jgi:hypothetical protein
VQQIVLLDASEELSLMTYGYWSSFELMGRSDKKLVILTIYQVTQKTGIAGSTTAYTQQPNMF